MASLGKQNHVSRMLIKTNDLLALGQDHIYPKHKRLLWIVLSLALITDLRSTTFWSMPIPRPNIQDIEVPFVSSFFYFVSACVVYGLSWVFHSVCAMAAMMGESLPLFGGGMINWRHHVKWWILSCIYKNAIWDANLYGEYWLKQPIWFYIVCLPICSPLWAPRLQEQSCQIKPTAECVEKKS